jgi:hypothetical protein
MVTTSTVTAGAVRAHILKDVGAMALKVNRYYKVPLTFCRYKYYMRV